jgi:hypothetical protein
MGGPPIRREGDQDTSAPPVDGGRWAPAPGHEPAPRPEWRLAVPSESPQVAPIRMTPEVPRSPALVIARVAAWIGLALGTVPLWLFVLALRTGPAVGVSLAMLASAWPLLLALFAGLLATLPLPVISLMAWSGRLGRRPSPLGLVFDLLPAALAGAIVVFLASLR